MLVGIVTGDEVHELGEVDRPEQLHRVDVALAHPQAEVQHRAVVRLAGTAAGADDVAARDGLARVHRDRREERVRRAEVAVVRDHDVQRARNVTGEADDAVVRGAYRGARDGREIGAAMTVAEHGSRRAERFDDPAVDRTLPDAGGRVVAGRGCRQREGRHRERGAEHDEESGTDVARELRHEAPPWSEGHDTGKEQGAAATVARGLAGALGITEKNFLPLEIPAR